jgi:hypothetical protein
MSTIYKALITGEECPIEGDHWIKIGYQSSDPKTDLRSTGLLSPIQFLAFIDRYPLFAKEICEYSRTEDYNFPMAILFINLTSICVEFLKNGQLIPLCNSKNSVILALNELFFGLIYNFFTNYKVNYSTIHDIPEYLNRIKANQTNSPSQYLNAVINMNKRYPFQRKDSMSLSENAE